MTVEARFADAKLRALELIDADRPVEALTAMTQALHRLAGLEFPAVAAHLCELRNHPGIDGLREWVDGLELP